MTMRAGGGWGFHNPVQIHSGAGALRLLPEIVGPALLVVTSAGFQQRDAARRLASLFRGRDVVTLEGVESNPAIADVERQIAFSAAAGPRDIVAIGGGSVLDTGKILAAAGANGSFSLRDHFTGAVDLPSSRHSRLVCIPTTSGSGSEVTPFATVWDRDARKKYSVSGETLFADVALVDPELTLSLPEEVTISTGLDAITQAFEATWSVRANPISTGLAVRAIAAGMEALVPLRNRPRDLGLRAAMAEASLLAGLAISSTRTALCHSISYPVTAHLGVPHGFACAFVLPEVFAFASEADPSRFERLALELGCRSAGELESRVGQLLCAVEIGKWMRRWVRDSSDLTALAPEMLTPGRADNTIRAATVADVELIVERAWRERIRADRPASSV